MSVRIIVGSCLDVLPTLEAKSVQMCVTSPPYWNLRDYGVAGQLGLEATVEEYVANMVLVFREVWRVLRDDSTLWLNIGDSYAGSGNGWQKDDSSSIPRKWLGDYREDPAQGRPPGYISSRQPNGLKPKDLCLIPSRLALALQADGWYLRSAITWCKRAPMPESVTDRPTSATEMIYLFAKKPNYFYDAEAVREPYNPETVGRYQYAMMGTAPGARQPGGDIERREREKGVREPNPAGRNQRNFWLLGPEPYPESHFAVFPTEIPRRAILAGTSERGCCPACGAPWKRMVEREREYDHVTTAPGKSKSGPYAGQTGNGSGTHDIRHGVLRHSTTTGWAPTCRCDAGEPVPCTVLDPFFGAGTTGLVSSRLSRDCVGIELSPTYAEMARRRIYDDAPMLADVTVETLQKEVA